MNRNFRELTIALFFAVASFSAEVDNTETQLSKEVQLSRETQLSRYARGENGVLSKEYDFEGGRAYWINGISILGLPDVYAGVMGISSPALRLPLGFAGLYTLPPNYERYGLSLNASNGKITESHRPTPLDTPTTALLWERYGFDGNALRLDFNRALLDSIGFSLGISSHSVSSSGLFNYTDVVHNLFTGTLGRDSGSVPFTGRNLGYNSIHLVPAVTWYMPNSSIKAKFSYLFLDDEDATRDIFSKNSSGTSINFPKAPYNIYGSATFYELGWNYRFLPAWELKAAHRIAQQEFKYSSSDTNFTTVKEKFDAQSGEVEIAHKTFLNPYWQVNYEFLESPASDNNESETLSQDRELFLLGIRDTLWRVAFKGETGLQRNSSVFDKADFSPAIFGGITLALPYRLSLNGNFQKDTRYPDLNENSLFRVGRVTFPNPNLKPETRTRWETNLTYSSKYGDEAERKSKAVFYQLGFRYEEAQNLIMPYWAIPRIKLLDSIAADSAFMWANAKYARNNEVYFRVGFPLGNWIFYAEHGKTISRSKLINIPSRYWKGAIYWSNRFVENRLKVSTQFDADWFGNRYEYGITDTLARPNRLKHYLSLNFKAAMQIQDFTLYSRIENMNHSLMEPAVGYAPAGIRFAYGIEWQLRD
ncbi:hypothetical protein AGMMS49938_18170 [Fibrobacterales bacterium]|nr:hypothetical protein AGMMS49938_18170 [Fibrobacterales bacterium]